MKLYTLLKISAVLAGLLALNSTLHARPITITTGEFPPWTGATLPHQGYVNHIISASFAAVDRRVEFVYLPWKRAYEEVKRGKYDLTSYWYEDASHRDIMLLSEPLIQNRTVFFQRSEDPPIHWQSLDDFAPYRMSATVGFTYTPEFRQAILDQRLQVSMVPSDVQNIKMLMSGRVDVIATDEMSGFYMAATLSVDPRKLRVLEPELAKVYGYVMANKSNPEAVALIAAFNRGLDIIKQNGTYQSIINRVDNTSFYNPATNGEALTGEAEQAPGE